MDPQLDQAGGSRRGSPLRCADDRRVPGVASAATREQAGSSGKGHPGTPPRYPSSLSISIDYPQAETVHQIGATAGRHVNDHVDYLQSIVAEQESEPKSLLLVQE